MTCAGSIRAGPAPDPLDPVGRAFLRRAIDLSRVAPPAGGDLPFGAVVVLGGQFVGEGRNEITTRTDPTAHAEILALRAAAARLGRPDLPGSVLYSSSEPCPMCLAACYWSPCYWSRIAGVVCGAGLANTAEYGFEDSAYYRQLALPCPALPCEERDLPVDGDDGLLRAEAVAALHHWHDGGSEAGRA